MRRGGVTGEAPKLYYFRWNTGKEALFKFGFAVQSFFIYRAFQTKLKLDNMANKIFVRWPTVLGNWCVFHITNRFSGRRLNESNIRKQTLYCGISKLVRPLLFQY